MKYHEFTAMNTSVLFAAEGDNDKVETGFREAEEFIHSAEQRFSRFRDDSELSDLNRSAGIWFSASPEMFDMVSLAYSGYQDTGGLFNPGILPALERSGYDRSMELIRGRSLTAPAPGEYVPDNGAQFSQVRFNNDRRQISLPLGLRIDLGGIAKGWIAEQAALRLSRHAYACLVDAGGDLFMVGLPAHEQAWNVAVEDPFDPERDLAFLKLGPGAVTTSTVTRRRWQQAGRERHHLIDPRTAQPAQAAWVSVSAITAHAARAEILAKALLIGGPLAARGLLKRFPGATFVAVDQNKKLWGEAESEKVYLGN